MPLLFKRLQTVTGVRFALHPQDVARGDSKAQPLKAEDIVAFECRVKSVLGEASDVEAALSKRLMQCCGRWSDLRAFEFTDWRVSSIEWTRVRRPRGHVCHRGGCDRIIEEANAALLPSGSAPRCLCVAVV